MVYKYHVPGVYHQDENHHLISKWEEFRTAMPVYKEYSEYFGDEKIRLNAVSFGSWLKGNENVSLVKGNWEDGWTLYFNNESDYTMFLLKWG